MAVTNILVPMRAGELEYSTSGLPDGCVSMTTHVTLRGAEISFRHSEVKRSSDIAVAGKHV
jgi:hypothetical protein